MFHQAKIVDTVTPSAKPLKGRFFTKPELTPSEVLLGPMNAILRSHPFELSVRMEIKNRDKDAE